MSGRTVTLRGSKTKHVGNEDDVECESEAEQSLTVDALVWATAVRLAESNGFRLPRGNSFFPAQAQALANGIRRGIENPATTNVGTRGSSRFVGGNQASDFFQDPRHRREALRIAAFAENGGALEVC